MSNVRNTLFPPQISTFQPAFICNKPAEVYFSLSPYNDVIPERVHVSLVKQSNNENAFENRPTGIYIIPNGSIKLDEERGLYKIRIEPSLIKGGMFEINQMYKLQIRFDSNPNGPDNYFDENVVNNYLIEHKEDFSEWSSVCLLRPISVPHLFVRIFDGTETQEMITLNPGIVPVSGRVYFTNPSDATEEIYTETETLQSFQIIIYDELSENILMQTETIYTGDEVDPNNIFYRLDLQGLMTSAEEAFQMRIKCLTRNQYEIPAEQSTYTFTLSEYIETDEFKPIIEVDVDNEDGIVHLHIDNEDSLYGILYIKRSSNQSNFKKWEDVQQIKVSGPVHLSIRDNTVSSLMWYRYSVQLENTKGGMSPVRHSQKFIPDFYDAIISRGSTQFKIKYNYNISSFKPVVNRTKIDTLGGRYPKFAENAVLHYKQFSISGLLTAISDDNMRFLNQEKYFGDSWEDFLIYNKVDSETFKWSTEIDPETGTNKKIWLSGDTMDTRFGYGYPYGGTPQEPSYFYINQQAYERNDFFWEREFREAVIEWLNDGEPKLYRSMAEGNLAVMFTDISLTPNAQLGRRIWNFSATVYEVGDGTSLTDLDALGIYNVNKVTSADMESLGGKLTDAYTTIVKPFQIYNYTNEINLNIISNNQMSVYDITSQLQSRYAGVLKNKDISNCVLKNVKIYFHNKPNIYYLNNDNTFEYIDNPASAANRNKDPNRMRLGYVFTVQTGEDRRPVQIFVNEKGYYQLPNNLDITYLQFKEGDVITLDFILTYREFNTGTSVISNSSVDRTIVGQEQGIFQPQQYLGESIRSKYSFVKTDDYYEQMRYWRGICLDVDPYAIAHIKYHDDEKYNDYLVGHTGVLNMLKTVPVDDMCFLGRRMVKRPQSRQPYLKEWEFVVANEAEWSGDDAVISTETKNWFDVETGADLGKIWFNFDDVSVDPMDETVPGWLDNDALVAISGGVENVNQITHPKLNTVYKVAGGYKIYYRYQWYDFVKATDNTGLGRVPIQGQVNYFGNVIKNEY